MRPRNFPGRKDERRWSALKRLPAEREDAVNTVGNLQTNPRDIRTKKDRRTR